MARRDKLIQAAIKHAWKRMDEIDHVIEITGKEIDRALDYDKNANTTELNTTLIAQSNLYFSLMGRIEALLWVLESDMKDSEGNKIDFSTGEPMLKEKKPKILLSGKPGLA